MGEGAAGGEVAAPIWGAYMKTVKGKFCGEFQQPRTPFVGPPSSAGTPAPAAGTASPRPAATGDRPAAGPPARRPRPGAPQTRRRRRSTPRRLRVAAQATPGNNAARRNATGGGTRLPGPAAAPGQAGQSRPRLGTVPPAWPRRTRSSSRARSSRPSRTRCSGSGSTTTTRCSATSPARCAASGSASSPAIASASSCRPTTSTARASSTGTVEAAELALIEAFEALLRAALRARGALARRRRRGRARAARSPSRVDAMVEGVHFRLERRRDARRRRATGRWPRALSDLAAMGADAGEAYIALGVLPARREAELEGIAGRGARAATGTVIAGGDVTRPRR